MRTTWDHKMQIKGQEYDIHLGTLKLFGVAVSIASVMGVAMRWLQGEIITWRDVVFSLFISFCAGLLIALFTYDLMIGRGQVLIWLGLVGLAGVGAASVLELLHAWFIVGLSKKLQLKRKPRRRITKSQPTNKGMGE